MTALFRIGYGLYVVTSNDGKKDNGLIVNTVTQLTDNSIPCAVNINKANYSHHVIKQTGVHERKLPVSEKLRSLYLNSSVSRPEEAPINLQDRR